jgi:hypothetical protein
MCAAVPSVQGNVASSDLLEVSGIAASRKNFAVLWAHNDSGDSPRAFAIGPGGQDLGTYTIPGAEANDWEAMAIGPGPDANTDYLYFADTGDNNAVRPDVAIYRVPEPQVAIPAAGEAPGGGEIAGVETFVLEYPDRAHDAETLLVDPISGDIVIVTKELQQPEALVFRAPADIEAGATTTLEQVAQIDFTALPRAVATPPPGAPPLVAGLPHIPTAGDVSPDGELIAVRAYGTVWVWQRPEGEQLWDAFASPPCEAPSAIEVQGEAIAFHGDGYTTISEGANPAINHFAAQ